MRSDKRWWLSFANPSLPEGSQFLGGLVMRGISMLDAVQNAHLAKLNPGGEVLGQEIPEWARDKLLDRSECARLNAHWKGEMPS